MSLSCTELSSYDKGKILVYMKNFNIAKKIGYYSSTIHRFINKYKKTRSIKNLSWSE